MINLLLVYDQMNTTTEVNLSGTKSIFDDGNHDVKIVQSKFVKQEDLEWCDVCFGNRPSSIYMVKLSQALRNSGRIFMSLYDDDLLNLPKGNSGRWKTKYVLKCLKYSDIVITPNPLIADSYKKIVPNPKYVVINTHIREDEIKPIPATSDKIRIVYAAGGDHTFLFDKFVKPFLDEIAEMFQHKLDMTLMGIHPDLSRLKYKDWIRQIDAIPYEQYKQYMMLHDFDIGLAPLEDNPFSNRKYFNKFFEYSKNGIVGLYSNCLPYTLIIKNNVNGILVENSVDAWKKALCDAISQIDKVKCLVMAAQDQLRSDFSISAVRRDVYNEIDDLIIDNRMRGSLSFSNSFISEIKYELFSKYNQIVANLYREGLFKTIKKILVSI